MIRNWQEYAEKNIDMRKPIGQRPFVKNDDLSKFEWWSRFHTSTINHELQKGANTSLEDKRILDFGCGSGRLPIGLDSLDVNVVSYTGIDVVESSIDFLEKGFKNNTKYKFVHSKMVNKRYSPHNLGTTPVLPDNNYNVVIAWSVFTHTGHPSNAEMYLNWLVSVTDKNCVYYITWFRSPPNTVNFDERRSVYHENTIRNLYKSSGLKILAEFGGNTKDNENQWRIVAEKY